MTILNEEVPHIRCSIIIVNWRSIEYLIECIGSIHNHTKARHEIIVVDNDSSVEEKEKLQTLKNINLILNSKNIGFAAANNMGIRIAQGEYIFLLNPDTKLENDAIDLMADFLDQNPNVSAVGPKLFFSNKGQYHPSVKSLDSPLYNLFFLLPGSLIFKNAYQFFLSKQRRPKVVQCLIGAAVLFRRTVFDRIDIFDEVFFIYSEEVDLFMRMKKAGLITMYLPFARVIHYGGKSQEKASVTKLEYLWSSKINYFYKHFGRTNCSVHLWLIWALLHIKIFMLGKRNLLPVCNIIWNRVKADLVDTES